jgi:MinD-like ATPase involved in chromosome partitioning or flagellar assembly
MAETFATEVAGLDAIPSTKSNGAVHNARLRRFRATVEYDGQASGDTVVLADVPAGYAFAYGVLTATATAGASATIAIGTASSAGKYRTAAVFTAANTPTMFGNAAATDDAPLVATERVIATVGVAALPNSADKVVVDLYFSGP